MNEEDAKELAALRVEVAGLRARVEALEAAAAEEPQDQLRRGWLTHRENARRKERGQAS